MTENNNTGSAAPEAPKRLTPQQIVQSAFNYLNSSLLPNQRVSDVRVEQLEPMEEDKFWKVVMSYDAQGDLPFDKKREYKEFKVNAVVPGEVIYMKIFERSRV